MGTSHVCGRLAPSPTGYLHLGNIWSFLFSWLAVRSCNGRLILRIEDIDPERSRPEFVSELVKDLYWLGLDWDEGPDVGGGNAPYLQSSRKEIYENHMAVLEEQGLLYPCFCSRKELRSVASAPHMGEYSARYSGKCRKLDVWQYKEMYSLGRKSSLRIKFDKKSTRFVDKIQGEQFFSNEDAGGDFILQRSDGVISYQLAVSVDDAMMGVNLVVRGRDILSSTPRQIFLFEQFGYCIPQYGHVGLLLDGAGERLSKRHGSLSIKSLRASGLKPGELVGKLAFLAGLLDESRPIMPADLLKNFDFSRLPVQDISIGAFLH